MTPIESIYDHRLLTLLNSLIDLSEDMAIKTGNDPSLILAESLLKNTRKILQGKEQNLLDKVRKFYPTLLESLD
jgi:hypothetical protein